MRSLKARELIPPQGDRHERNKMRRSIPGFALLVAGIATVAVSFVCVEKVRKNILPPVTEMPITSEKKANAPNSSLSAGKTRPHGRLATPEMVPPDSPVSVSAVSNHVEFQLRTLSWTFQHADIDCPMLPAAYARSKVPEGIQSGELVGQMLRLHDGTYFHDPVIRSSYHHIGILRSLYDKTSVWNVLPFVQHLDSLGLESGPTNLFDEYAKIWNEGVSEALPDPGCMEKIAEAISLLRMTRNDLSELLGKDPSIAPETLGSLSEHARSIVLSGAVRIALAEPGQPNIEDLFDILATEDKIALIKMLDSSLPESERLSVVRVQSLPSLPESGLWDMLSERMDKFEDYSSERGELSRMPVSSGK